MAKKSAKSKGFRRQNAKKPYLSKRDIVTLCVIVALLAVGAFFLFRYDDGALKVRDGAVVTEGDNWLIVDGSNVRGRSRYFKLGEVGELDGYTRSQRPIVTDVNVPQYVYTPEAEDGAGLEITVTTGHSPAGKLADYTLSRLQAEGNAAMSELQSAEMAGREMHYYTYTTEPAEAEEAADAETPAEEAADAEAPAEEAADAEAPAEQADADAEAPAEEAADAEAPAEEAGKCSRAIAGYFDATHDSCVVVFAQSRADTLDACLSEEALAGLMEQAAAAVTLEEAK